ncbi:MAG TPA: hypothetical protein ENN20_09495 [Candidatus Marinimicrobia bacterium]|nr:hypothetical protein [Candidatus Neomarinimicrobiota bacterium]
MSCFKHPWRISGITGILFVGLSFLAAGINVLPPAYNQEKALFATWFSENGQWFRFGHWLAGIAFLLFYFPFYAGFCEKLRAAEGKPALWTRVTWAGAIMSPAAGTIAGAFIIGEALIGGGLSAEVAPYGVAANFYAYTVSGAYGGVAMLGAAVIILRTAVFSRWLGWAGLVIGLAAVTSVFAIVENDPAGFFAGLNGIAWLAYFLWIAALSIELVIKPAGE